MATHIALLGARQTGKTTLAQTLAEGLEQANVGPVAWVPAPTTPPEPDLGSIASMDRYRQAALAQAQATDRCARAVGPHGWVVTDTPALQFRALHPGLCDPPPPSTERGPCPETPLWLLMGMDLPTATHPAWDTALRQALALDGTPVQTIYGQGADRVHAAWQALLAKLGPSHPASNAIQNIAKNTENESGRRLKSLQFKPVCENCGNAECEHRLFRQLIAGRR